MIVADPGNSTTVQQMSLSDVEGIIVASESLMLKGLLDQLNEREVLDLIAYTLARGNKNDGRFKKP